MGGTIVPEAAKPVTAISSIAYSSRLPLPLTSSPVQRRKKLLLAAILNPERVIERVTDCQPEVSEASGVIKFKLLTAVKIFPSPE